MNKATAYEIQAEIASALGPAIRAELDPVVAGNLLASSELDGVVVIPPPSLEYPTGSTCEATWKLILAAPHPSNYLPAWDTFDTALPALQDVLDFDSALQVVYEAAGTTKTYPAYEITLVTHHNL